MLEPLKQWFCDNCGKMIRSPKEGWVEWQHEMTPDNHDHQHSFKIVHHPLHSPRKPQDCYYNTGIPGNYLNEIMDTVMPFLFDFLDPGPLFEPNYQGPKVNDM